MIVRGKKTDVKTANVPDPAIVADNTAFFAYLHKKYGKKTEAEQQLEDGEEFMARLAAKITSAAKNRSTIGWKTVKLEIVGQNAIKAVAKKFFGVAVHETNTRSEPTLTRWLPLTEIPLLIKGRRDGKAVVEEIAI